MIIFYEQQTGTIVGRLEGFDADPQIGYSDGRVKSLVLDERHFELAAAFDRPDMPDSPYDFTVLEAPDGSIYLVNDEKRYLITSPNS